MCSGTNFGPFVWIFLWTVIVIVTVIWTVILFIVKPPQLLTVQFRSVRISQNFCWENKHTTWYLTKFIWKCHQTCHHLPSCIMLLRQRRVNNLSIVVSKEEQPAVKSVTNRTQVLTLCHTVSGRYFCNVCWGLFLVMT